MPKVLVAPGSGDIHWIMLKMESICKHKGWGRPEVWIWSENRKTERSAGYIERLPFVKFGGYFRAEKHVQKGIQTFVHGKPWLMWNWNGFDLFVAFNAPLGWGTDISKLMPDYDINWNYEIRLTDEDLWFGDNIKNTHGPYIPVSFFGHSFYKRWLDHFGPDKIKWLLKELSRKYTIVLTGREWDTFMANLGVRGNVNLVGKTSMGQLLGLMKEARAFVGFAAGNGMLAQHLNCPTFMLWDPQQWHPGFATNWVDPKRRENGTYHPLSIKAPCIGYITERLNGCDLSADSSTFGNLVPDRAVQDQPEAP